MLRAAQLQHPQPRCHGGWSDPCPDAEGERIEHVWDGSVDSFSNSIRVHISALRKKLRAVLGYDPIRNRIGEGYEIGGEVQ